MVQIDLKATIIPAQTRVWRLFPGKHYKFLPSFVADKLAFLDIPGFEMPDTPLSETDDLPKRIRRSEIVIEKIRQDGRDAIPVVTANDLRNFRVGTKRQRNQQAVINFYQMAAPGDLIITPDRLSQGRVWIGEFAGRARRIIDVKIPDAYGDTRIPARRVNWFGHFPENKISTMLSKALRHEHPFSLIERNLFLEVFSLAFSSYVFLDHHSATIYNTKNDYLDLETSLLGLVSSMAATMSEKVENGEDDGFDPIDAIFEGASIEFHCSIASDIHSEGFSRFTGSKFTPLVIAAFIAALSLLGGCDSKESVDAQRHDIEIVNSSAPPGDACTASVSETTLTMLQAMDIDRLWKTCQNMKDAERRAGLKSSATGHQ